MSNNLLILGAGIYGMVAKEIAESMGCFETISFVDDSVKQTPNGIAVLGTSEDLRTLSVDFKNVIVAIGNPNVRLQLLQRIKDETLLRVATLISPMSYVSPTASIGEGSIIEPMSVIHTGCFIGKGCLISAGAVINHASICCDGVHVDCNATVAGGVIVPTGTKVGSGTVFQNVAAHGPLRMDGKDYCFEDGM